MQKFKVTRIRLLVLVNLISIIVIWILYFGSIGESYPIVYFNGKSITHETNSKINLTLEQVEPIIKAANYSYNYDKSTNMFTLTPNESEQVESFKLEALERESAMLVQEEDLQGAWMTREDDNIVTYMFDESGVFGAYTVTKFITKEDKSKEVIYSGTYSIDRDNNLTFNFIYLLDENDELVARNEGEIWQEIWKASIDNVFITLERGEQQIQMRYKRSRGYDK